MLVTGASGFVGRAVCTRALSLGFGVRGSHRSPGSSGLVPAGVEKLRIPSIDHKADWSRALEGVSAVVHLAGRVHVPKDIDGNSLAAFREVNTFGTERLARTAAAVGVQRFIYVSTIKVNGEQTLTMPFTERDPPCPEDAYAISKWESEQALHRIGNTCGLEIVILRPPLVYGGGVGANFLRLLRLIHRCIPLPFASVSNRRSFIYVKNLADAILASAVHPKATGQTFCVSDGEDVSTPELIRRIAHAMEVPSRMFWFPPSLLNAVAGIAGKSAEVCRLLGSLTTDSSKFRFETGWIPRYTLSQGLAETIEWYLANELITGEVSSASDGFVPRLGPSSKH
jgi:nucleoside-diphosphate-sugar epimerase